MKDTNSFFFSNTFNLRYSKMEHDVLLNFEKHQLLILY